MNAAPQRLGRSIGWLLGLNLLVKPIWILLIDRAVQNAVGHAEYGLYFSVWSFALLFGALLDMGTQSFVTRRVARRPESLALDFWFLVELRLLLIGVYSASVLGGGWLLGWRGTALEVLFLVVLGQALLSMVLLLRGVLNGLHLFSWEAVLSVMDRVWMILLVGALLIGVGGWHISVKRFAAAQVVAYAVTLTAAWWAVRPHVRGRSRQWTWRFFRALLRQSAPYALLTLLMTLYTRTDSVMLERLRPHDGAWQAGVYAASYRFLDAAVMVPFLISTRLLPVFSRLLKQRRPVSQVANRALPLMMGWGWLVALSAAFYADELMPLFYREVTTHHIAVFRWLMPTLLFHGLVYLYGSLLTAAGRLKYLNVVSAVGFLTNILLNAWAVPRYGAVGAVAATLVTQGVVSAIQAHHALRVHRIRIGRRQAWGIAGWALGTLGWFAVSIHLPIHFVGALGIAWGGAAIFAIPYFAQVRSFFQSHANE